MRTHAMYCDVCGVEIRGPHVSLVIRERNELRHTVEDRSLDLCHTHAPSARAVEARIVVVASNALAPHEAAVQLVSRELGGTERTVLAASVLAGLLRVAPVTLVDDLERVVSRYGDTDDRELVHELVQLVKAKRAEQGATIGAAPAAQEGSGWWEP